MLRQKPNQTLDDFAAELNRLAALAFPSSPDPHRQSQVLHRFMTGLFDPKISEALITHPPPLLPESRTRLLPFLPIVSLNPSAITGIPLSTVSRTQPIYFCSPDDSPYLPTNNF
ncbi:unnamed protein product [Dibothriocephalus latus]|uniref:Retrotransposon gag domain-containing protein n=1 Tax=Dibothriocephalus latus TaxID=60516 RepID=A0A3P7LUD3_DIBLA|nr:unnamed protein product [Dibothriocephalus latus]